MKVITDIAGREQTLVEIVRATFTASEGTDEGALVGDLARDLLSDTPKEDIRVFCAEDQGDLVGAAIFTRLTYPEDPHIVFLLSPMAVASTRQQKGVGQALLRTALDALRAERIEVAITYGDPNFYGKVGFRPITENQARAPLPLSLPHGWIGQSLTDEAMPTLKGPSACVSALNRAELW